LKVRKNILKTGALVFVLSVFVGVFPLQADGQSAQAPLPGLCDANFQACYNVCRIRYPGQGFKADQGRVACGNICLQQQGQCQGQSQGKSQGQFGTVSKGYIPYQPPQTYARPPAISPKAPPAPKIAVPVPPVNTPIEPNTVTRTQPQPEERESGFMAPVDNVIGGILRPLPAKRKKKYKR
jgi:hypothetical protein